MPDVLTLAAPIAISARDFIRSDASQNLVTRGELKVKNFHILKSRNKAGKASVRECQ